MNAHLDGSQELVVVYNHSSDSPAEVAAGSDHLVEGGRLAVGIDGLWRRWSAR
jgi:hypothetical protein